MVVRWIFFAWASIAAALLTLASIDIVGLTSDPRGDDFIVFGLSGLGGLPAFLIVAALTAYNWRSTSRLIALIQNAPAAVCILIFVILHLTRHA